MSEGQQARPAGRSFGPHVDGDRGEWAELSRLAGEDPDRAWSSLLEVAATTDEAGLFWVADVLEDLIRVHGEALAPRLERELATNPALRRAFSSVVPLHADRRVEERFLELRDRLHAEGEPR